jgi:hypothetical protein
MRSMSDFRVCTSGCGAEIELLMLLSCRFLNVLVGPFRLFDLDMVVEDRV